MPRPHISQANLVVSDLERAKTFYEALGWSFRPITLPDDDAPQAYLTTDGPVLVGLNAARFAAWWDPTGPGVVAGSTVIDLDVELGELDALVALLSESGGCVESPPQDMPWGDRYAVVGDPDGHRWGLGAAWR